jgi:hypothetical protein
MKKCIISSFIIVFMCGSTGVNSSFAQCTYGSEKVTNGGFECISPCVPTDPLNSPHLRPGAATQAGLDKASIGSGYNYRADGGGTSVWCDGTGGGATNSLGSGNYIITKNPAQCCDCQNNNSPATHSGSYAMLIDGGTSGLNAWCQTVSVSSGATYSFTAWYKQPNTGTSNNASLVMTVDGVDVSGLATLDGTVTAFREAGCFIAPTAAQASAGSVTICLKVVTNGSTSNNDMLIDDVSFKQVSNPGTGSCTATAGACTYNGVSISLPVELLSFSAHKSSYGKSSIQWSSASEKNTLLFSVEKSPDGTHFYEIGKVDAAGNSLGNRPYELEDNNFNSSCYYRLKMLDKDGSFQYSKIIFLTKKENDVWLINNFPGSEELEIKAFVGDPVKWTIKIYSVLGEEYLNQQVSLSAGENSLLKRKNGRKGTCICRISDENGAVIYLGKVFW